MVVIISVKPPTANTRNTSTWTLAVLLRLQPYQQPQPRLSRRLKNTRRRRKPRRRRKRRARRRKSPRKARRQGSICAVFLLKLDQSKGILNFNLSPSLQTRFLCPDASKLPVMLGAPLTLFRIEAGATK